MAWRCRWHESALGASALNRACSHDVDDQMHTATLALCAIPRAHATRTQVCRRGTAGPCRSACVGLLDAVSVPRETNLLPTGTKSSVDVSTRVHLLRVHTASHADTCHGVLRVQAVRQDVRGAVTPVHARPRLE